MLRIKRLLSFRPKSKKSSQPDNFLEYRVMYQSDEGSGVTYGKTLDLLTSAMSLFRIQNRYLIEGFDGLMWFQLEKSQDYDIN